ncbi:MAG TPA: hypothetical protein ENG74_03565 [Thermoplasmatales archaeon]|nr:hypothetical protein [Thermoplasmatales archaeon]
MRKATLVFLFDNVREAEIIAKSIEPEVKKKIPKTSLGMSLNGKELILEIISDDTSSLRAACNSFLRWIEAAYRVKEII